jgi:hypothetical protein
VANGGFEWDGAWAFPPTASRAIYTAARAHSGLRSAQLGLQPGAAALGLAAARGERNLLGQAAAAGASYSTAYQSVSIPADAGSAWLRFWYWPLTAATSGDWQRVLLLEPVSYRLAEVLWSGLANTESWRVAQFDLTAYRGRNLVLYLEVYNDDVNAWTRTGMYLDDVSLAACERPVPPTPTPTPAGGQRPRAWLPLFHARQPNWWP